MIFELDPPFDDCDDLLRGICSEEEWMEVQGLDDTYTHEVPVGTGSREIDRFVRENAAEDLLWDRQDRHFR